MQIKTPRKKVMFNMIERKLCKQCNYPEGFCKHTIEEELKELCPDTPLDKEDIWQLVRSYAILRTQQKNINYHNDKDIAELKQNNNILSQENTELKHFKKQIGELLSKLNVNK